MLKKILNLEGVKKVEKQQLVMIIGGGREDGFTPDCFYDNSSALSNGCKAQPTNPSWVSSCTYVCVNGHWVKS
ncbi:hypothetical protein [Flavobacterium sp. '19STA2R22 D10 B1']|uniref:hypothetical protein n=1 Tax=Flavobacterium aerium TaxID=3037261 RepID=UPI00278BD6A3|nr:hypothetical protein [Flavobacterium sp. '19STA2R22 D10 B1']